MTKAKYVQIRGEFHLQVLSLETYNSHFQKAPQHSQKYFSTLEHSICLLLPIHDLKKFFPIPKDYH